MRYVMYLIAGFLCGLCSAEEWVITDESTKPEVKTPNDKPYFIMFTTAQCSPCQRWKASELKKVQAAGYQVTIIDINQDDRWNAKYNVTTVPRFFLLDRKTRRTLKGPWVGFTPAVTLIVGANGKNLLAPADHSRKVARITCEEIRAMVRQRYRPGQLLNADVSPQSMVWGHLTDGSGGTHNFASDQVSCLSLWEALALHDDAHGARVIRP